MGASRPNTRLLTVAGPGRHAPLLLPVALQAAEAAATQQRLQAELDRASEQLQRAAQVRRSAIAPYEWQALPLQLRRLLHCLAAQPALSV